MDPTASGTQSSAPASSTGGLRVVIVGGGFSGVAVATHLLRRADRGLHVTLVERGASVGRGVAYGVENRVVRLNVPAAKMSLDPDAPGDFVAFAAAEASPNAFLPRAVYAEYIAARFGSAVRESAGTLCTVRGDAVCVLPDAVVLADGARLPADVVVLATGLEARPTASAVPPDPRIVDAWDEPSVLALPRTGKLLVLGAGLTALDVIALLVSHGFSGELTVVSRRGLLPRPHLSTLRPTTPLGADVVAELPKDLRALLAWGRAVIQGAVERGEPWQTAIDAIRPHTGRLWRNLPPADRKRFVRSVRPYWEVLRHRAPADALAVVDAWREQGRIELVAGSVASCVSGSDGLDVALRQRGGAVRHERYDAMVRCIGPALERSEAETPIVRDLIATGRAAADEAGLGLATDEEGRVRRPDNEPDSRLFAIGALRRASSWETTSVPDISVHALAIAKQIVP